MEPNYIYEYEMPAKLVFGAGASAKTGDILKQLGGGKALVVTDSGIRKAGLLTGILESLDKAGMAWSVFDEVEPNPTIACVDRAVALYQGEGCDCLLGIGGGSSIDTAKATGVLISNPGKTTDFEGARKFSQPLPPFVAIPTTCGTGAEVTFNAVVTDPARQFKFTITSPLTVPKVALIDPVLLTTLPGAIVASTGMDALTHAIESFTTKYANPVSDALNLHAIRLIGKHLRPAAANGNLDDISHMVLASTITGMAFSTTGLTIVHAMSHPLGGRASIAHGVANAILLPYVMDFNLIGAMQRFADVADALGEDTSGLSLMEAARLSVEAVFGLCADTGIPGCLSQIGITEDLIPVLTDDAMLFQRLIQINPRRVTREDIVDIYRRALAG